MNTETGILVHPGDAWKEETGRDVYDADGDHVGSLMSDYSDEQLRDIVRFANGFFAVGLRIGRAEAQSKVRAALGLADQAQQKGPQE